jgi:hypothetical protein
MTQSLSNVLSSTVLDTDVDKQTEFDPFYWLENDCMDMYTHAYIHATRQFSHPVECKHIVNNNITVPVFQTKHTHEISTQARIIARI